MFDNCLDENTLTSAFWHIKPQEKRLFQKKGNSTRFIYLLLLRWFERHHQFPAITDIPEELIWSGVEF